MGPLRLTAPETEAVKHELADWNVTADGLQRPFVLRDFEAVSILVSEILVLAKALDHHPELSLSYDRVNVVLTTHDAGGMTERDVVLARGIDRLYRALREREGRALPEAPRKAREAALRTFVYGAFVIGSRADDELNGMTANWVTQLSFEPCLLGVAVENDAHTRKLIEEGRVFSVNVLPEEQGGKLAEIFVRPQRRVGQKLGEVSFHEGPLTGAPILDAAAAAVECELVTAHATGDHTLFVGRVVGAEAEMKSAPKPLTLSALGWHYAG